MNIAVVGRRQERAPSDLDEFGTTAVDRGIVLDDAQDGLIQVAFAPRLFPIQPVDHRTRPRRVGCLDGVAQERAPSVVPGQAGGMNDQRLPPTAKPDDPAGGLQPLVVLANHAGAWLGLEDIPVGIDLAITDNHALDRTESEIGDGLRNIQIRVGHPRGVGWWLLGRA